MTHRMWFSFWGTPLQSMVCRWWQPVGEVGVPHPFFSNLARARPRSTSSTRKAVSEYWASPASRTSGGRCVATYSLSVLGMMCVAGVKPDGWCQARGGDAHGIILKQSYNQNTRQIYFCLTFFRFAVMFHQSPSVLCRPLSLCLPLSQSGLSSPGVLCVTAHGASYLSHPAVGSRITPKALLTPPKSCKKTFVSLHICVCGR